MSYTLRGRLETRLAAAVPVLLAAAGLAAALSEWWPIELLAVMLGSAVALDLLVYHRLIPYQPGWAAVPLGLLELAVILALVSTLGIDAPLRPALALFAGAWLLGQLLVHAGLPLARLTYGESGGELGRAGPVLATVALAVFAFSSGVAWSMRPPTVHLASGVHRGPIVVDREQTLVGTPGTVVQGGIVVRADGVTIRNVAVRGGENGIVVDDADRVVLDRVSVEGSHLDGIQVRRGSVTIRNCRIGRLRSPYAQGIDISFSMDKVPSVVERCVVAGGQEAIVTHSADVIIRNNRVGGTSMRGITMTEMSMGRIAGNHVAGGVGVGIFCGDHSMCEIERNHVTDIRPDAASSDGFRQGFGIVSHFYAEAKLSRNHAPNVRAFANGTVEHEDD